MSAPVPGMFRAAARAGWTARLAAQALAGIGGRRDPSRRNTALLGDLARRTLAVHGVEVTVSGSLPRGPALLVANHLSYLDPLVVLTQADCVPVAKAEVASWPLLGTVARRAGVLFVRRDDVGSRRAVLDAAEQVFREGGMVLNFPEGTTTDGSTVLRYRRGVFGVARLLGVPVVPVALRYLPRSLAWTGEATFLPHYLRFASMTGCTAAIAFGDPIHPEAHPSAKLLAGAARARTISLLEDRTRWLSRAR